MSPARSDSPPPTPAPQADAAASIVDEAAFARRLQDLGPGLRRYLQRQLGNADAADDAVQETFLRMLRYRDRCDIAEIRALLFRVAASVVADRRRQAKTHRADDHCDIADHELASDAPQPDRTLSGAQNLALLKRAILALPPRCREVFLMHRFEDLSYRDIAQRLGISERTVENQIAHALAVCRRALA